MWTTLSESVEGIEIYVTSNIFSMELYFNGRDNNLRACDCNFGESKDRTKKSNFFL